MPVLARLLTTPHTAITLPGFKTWILLCPPFAVTANKVIFIIV